jgi:hypothetical protein
MKNINQLIQPFKLLTANSSSESSHQFDSSVSASNEFETYRLEQANRKKLLTLEKVHMPKKLAEAIETVKKELPDHI